MTLGQWSEEKVEDFSLFNSLLIKSKNEERSFSKRDACSLKKMRCNLKKKEYNEHPFFTNSL